MEGLRRPVTGAFERRGPARVGFAIGRYDGALPLVIDPVVVHSTFLGGSARDLGIGLAVDSSGCAYVAGFTYSSDLPATSGSFRAASNGGVDGFVAKLGGTGSSLEWLTYLGGSSSDRCTDIALDAAGNVYGAGDTTSANFPVTPGAAQTTPGGGSAAAGGDAFVAKLAPGGNTLVYSTYLGGTLADGAMALDADGDGRDDRLVHVVSEDLVLDAGSTRALLTGALKDGTPIEGSDSVRIVP